MNINIEIKDSGEYYYRYTNKQGKHTFELFKKIKHDTDSRILGFGSTDFKAFQVDLIFVVSVLVKEGIRDFSIRQYLV